MSISRYRYFSKVARLGSIREAAAVLHVAPSAVSRQIVKLEKELGTNLLEPAGRGIRLTPAGEIFARQASTMLAALEQGRTEIDDLLGLRRGHVRVWSVEGSVGDLVIPALANLHRSHPKISYEVTIAGSDEVVRALLDDDAELGVAFNVSAHPDLVTMAQIVDRLYAIVHPRDPIARNSKVSLSEIAQYRLALPDQTFGLRHMVDAAAKSAGIRIIPAVTTNSIEALRAFARSGMGPTIMPRIAVTGDVKRRLVTKVALSDRGLMIARTTVLSRRNRQLPVAATHVAQLLVKLAQSLGS